MDLFDSQAPTSGDSVDPAAAFLAAEQSKLAGLDLNEDPFGAQSSSASAIQPSSLEDGGLANLDVTAGAGAGAGAAGASDFLFDAPAASDAGGADAASAAGPGDGYSALREMDRMQTEPEKIRIWREKQKERLAAKDAEEEKKKAEWRAAAKRELEEWYRHYQEQMNKSNAQARDAERAYLEEREESAGAAGSDAAGGQGGAAWDRVARLCDFNPKNSKCSRDVSRFRGVLLQLKQAPPTAAAAK